jgi:hypothetical protein
MPSLAAMTDSMFTVEVDSPAAPADADGFARVVIRAICRASVTPQVGRRTYERCLRALETGSTTRMGFRHPGKAEAIDRIWSERDRLFGEYLASRDKEAFLASLPWIGSATRRGLAFDLGLMDGSGPDHRIGGSSEDGTMRDPAAETPPGLEDNDGTRRDRVMAKERASDVGFCVADSNADLIADTLVRRLRDMAAEMESHVNRMYRGRNAYDLNTVALLDVEKTIRRLNYMAATLRDVQKAQEDNAFNVTYLQAAE